MRRVLRQIQQLDLRMLYKPSPQQTALVDRGMIKDQQHGPPRVTCQEVFQVTDHLDRPLARVDAMEDLAAVDLYRTEDRPALISHRRNEFDLLADPHPHPPQHWKEPDVSFVFDQNRRF